MLLFSSRRKTTKKLVYTIYFKLQNKGKKLRETPPSIIFVDDVVLCFKIEMDDRRGYELV